MFHKLPKQLAVEVREQVAVRVVSWEDVLAQYRSVGPAYWTSMLDVALSRYSSLVSRGPQFGQNAKDKLTGSEIVRRHADGELGYDWMGRTQGLDGPVHADDIAKGQWRTQRYEVRHGGLHGNQNWFPIAQFISRTSHH
ncbi:hypothetical protein BH24ACT5_BH24ACT5_30920 [soil metagenome]